MYLMVLLVKKRTFKCFIIYFIRSTMTQLQGHVEVVFTSPSPFLGKRNKLNKKGH